MKRNVLLGLVIGACFCGCSEDAGLVGNGGSCVTNSDCKSHFCDKDVCRAKGSSSGFIVNGEACTSNEQCVSNNCYEGKVCRTPNWGGGSKLEIGDACSSNAQCISKSCKDNYCVSAGNKIPNGEACSSNEQCESGNCYEGKVCRTPNWGGDSKLELGSVCSGNDKCESNNCVSGVCNRAGVTEAKTANGLACSSNDECATSNCYEGKICRAVHWGGTSGKVGNGKSCTSNDQCVSNNCYEGKVCRAPNWGGSEKLEIGDACTSNDQCASEYCYDNTVCRAKGSGGSADSSKANEKYCEAVVNDCALDIYRNYDGCVDAMSVMRALEPDCTKEWDDAYVCIAASDCWSLEVYDKSLSVLDIGYGGPSVPENCRTLAREYIYCKQDKN